MKSNQELKRSKFDEIVKHYSYLNNYCTISAQGIDDDNIYFHPKFIINDNTHLMAQSDIGSNKEMMMYALKFIKTDKYSSVEIDISLLDKIIIGYSTNKEVVELALDTITKMKNHIRTLEGYCNEYISNVLIGNSIEEVGNAFIHEIKATNSIVSFIQKHTDTTTK